MTDRSHLSAFIRMTVPDTANAERDHFYPTPPGAVLPLLEVETFDGTIWEPACGAGDMSRVLEATGNEVISTDLIDRGYGAGGVDFLLDWSTEADHVVTNPPFKLAQQFVEHALRRVRGKVAILARLQWLETPARADLFRDGPLARVWVFSTRVPFQRGRLVAPGESGGRMMAYAWFVFDRSHIGAPALGFIRYREAA